MEYAYDGDLSTKIKQAKNKQGFCEESRIWSTLIQILEGLKYLHKSDIIHRDLKSSNIFLTKKGTVKIGDLNINKIIGKNMAITQTGTPYYASPEIGMIIHMIINATYGVQGALSMKWPH